MPLSIPAIAEAHSFRLLDRCWVSTPIGMSLRWTGAWWRAWGLPFLRRPSSDESFTPRPPTPTPQAPGDDPYAVAEEAYRFYEASEYGEAIVKFATAIKLHPYYGEKYAASHGAVYSQIVLSEWYNMKGVSYYYTKQYWGSIEDFTKAIRWNPTSGVAYYNRGVSHWALGNYGPGREDFAKACEIDAKHC